MFKYISTKLKDVLYLYPERTFKTIKTIRDNGTFGLFIYNPKIKDYIEVPNIDLLNCDEAFITRTLQICNNIQVSSSSSSTTSSTSSSRSTSSSSQGEFVERYLYGWGSNDYNQITKSLLATISNNHLGTLVNGVPRFPNLRISKIASGDHFNVAVVENKTPITGGGDSYTQTVYAWGDNRYGQVDRNSDPTIDGTSVTLAGGFGTGYERIVNTITKTEPLPSPLIACGKNHTAVLYSTGSSKTYIKLLGNNNYSQLGSSYANQFPSEFLSNTDNMLLTCGNYFTYIVDFGANFGEGEIYFNGDTRYKQNEIPSNITQDIQNINQLSAGGYHTAALLLDGTVVCWGKNTNGQCLGTDENGNAKISTTFGARTTINGRALTNIVKIVAGENHTCALNSLGVVICWGDNNRGQCTVPSTLFDAVDVYAKGDTTVAIKRDGSIVMWGDVSKDKNNIPSYAKFTQGSVFSIGKEHCILLANKTTQEIPETTAPLTHFNQYVTDYFNNNIVRVYVTFSNGDNDGLSIGTDIDGEILPYSRSEAGKLFSGDNPKDTFYITPNIVEETSYLAYKGGVLSPYVKIKNEMLTNVIQLTSGDGFIVALKADGNVVAWGKNNLGECDVPSSANTVKKIYSWETGSFALKQDGSIVSWGNTQNFPYSSFLTMTDVENYSFGNEHILILKKNGTITTITKGNDTYSLKLPPKKGKFTSIVSGYDHICALLDDGTVTCWGDDSHDQCKVPAGLNNVIQITCGLYLSAALKSDGTVVAWGMAAASQYGGQNTNIIKISAGPDYILALKNDHTVTMWPDVASLNNNGRNLALNNIPANIRTGQTRTAQNPDVVDISAGHNVACAVLADTGMICWGKTFSTNDDEGVLCGRGGKSDPDYPWTLGDKVKTKVVRPSPTFPVKIYDKYPYLPVDGAFKAVCEMSDLGSGVETSLNKIRFPENLVSENQNSLNYAGTVALTHGKIFSFGKLSLSLRNSIDGSFFNTWEKLQEDPIRYATPENISTSGINKDIVDVCFVNKRLWFVGKDYKVGAISLHEYDTSSGDSDLYKPDFYLNGDNINPNNKYDIFLKNIKVEQISAGRHHLIVVEKDTKNIYFFCHWNLVNSFKDSLKNIPAILKETPTQLNNIVKIQASYNNNIALSSNNKLYVWGEDTYFLHYFPEHFYVRDFGMVPGRILYLDFNNNVRTWGGVGGFVPPVWTPNKTLGPAHPSDTVEDLVPNTGNLVYGDGSLKNYISTDIYGRKLIPQIVALDKICKRRGKKFNFTDNTYIEYSTNSTGGPTKNEFGIIPESGPCISDSYKCYCIETRKRPFPQNDFLIQLTPEINSDTNPNTTRQKLNSWYSSRNNIQQGSEYIPFLLQRNTVYCIAGKVQKINDIKNPNIFSQSYIDKYIYHSGEENFAENDKTSNPTLRTDLEYPTVQPDSFYSGNIATLSLTAVAINSKDANVPKTQPLATPTVGYSVSSSKTSITDYHDYNSNEHPFRRKFSFDDDPKTDISSSEVWISYLWNTQNVFSKKFTEKIDGTRDYDQFYTQTIKYDVGWDDGTALFLGLSNQTRNMNGTGLGKVPFNNDLNLIGRNYADEIVKCGTALWAVGYNIFGESYGLYPNGEPRPILWKYVGDLESALYPVTQYATGPGGRNTCCLPQLKDSLLDPLYTPTQNTTRLNYFYCVREISCGLRYSCIVDEFGRVKCWGRNDTNQCNVPTIIASSDSKRAIDVKCGPFHACAMLKDGTVVCWGNNKIDQLDVPSDLTGVVAIECGAFHTCALKSDGTVRCWGNNREGQSDVPSSLKNVKQIACGHNHSIALRSDGKVVAWGSNEYGQCLGTDSNKNIIQKTTTNLGSPIKGNGLEVSNIIKIFGSIDKTWLLRETGTDAAELLAFGLDASGNYPPYTLGSRILNGPSWNNKEINTVPTNIGKMYNDSPTMFIKMPGCGTTTPATYPYCQLKTTLSSGTWINVVTSTSDIYGGDTATLDSFLKKNDEIEVGNLLVKGEVKSQFGIGFYNRAAQIVTFPGSTTKMWQCLEGGEYHYPRTIPVEGDVGICMVNSATITDIRKVGGIIQIKLNRSLHIPREIFDTYSPNDVIITFNNKQRDKPIYLEIDTDRERGRTSDAGLGNPYQTRLGSSLLKYTSSDPQPRFIHVTKSGIVTWFTDDPNPV